MRILHCIPTLMGGGAERQLTYLASHAARAGHEVHIAYLAGGSVPKALQDTQIGLHPIKHRSTHDPLLFVRLLRLIRTVRPDLVQTWLLQMDVLAGLAAFITHTPWLLREPVNGVYWATTSKAKPRRWIAQTADAVVSNSMSGDAYWREYKPANQRFVIENAVPVDAITAVPAARAEELGVPAGHPIVISVGRLDEQKNPAVLVRALARLVMETPAVGVICGEGPLRASLERLITETGAGDRIRLPGFTHNIWSMLKAARVFVSISAFEGRPNAVLEAMAARCPLVASDIPEHREILDEDSALLVKNYLDPNAVAAAIATALTDRAQAAARSERAFARAREASIERVAEAYEQVYATILARRRR